MLRHGHALREIGLTDLRMFATRVIRPGSSRQARRRRIDFHLPATPQLASRAGWRFCIASKANAMEHEPCCFLSHPKATVEFPRGDPVLHFRATGAAGSYSSSVTDRGIL
jgi:hypothetical protein